jgi:hypothetical protein
MNRALRPLSFTSATQMITRLASGLALTPASRPRDLFLQRQIELRMALYSAEESQ